MYQTHVQLSLLKADVASMRNDNEFETFWLAASQYIHTLELHEPKVPRPRKIPQRLDDNSGTQHSHTSVVPMYRQRYFEVIVWSPVLRKGSQAMFRTYDQHRKVHYEPDKLQHGILTRTTWTTIGWRCIVTCLWTLLARETLWWIHFMMHWRFYVVLTQNKKLVTCQFCCQKLPSWFALHWQSRLQLVLPRDRSQPFVDWRRMYDPPCSSTDLIMLRFFTYTKAYATNLTPTQLHTNLSDAAASNATHF